MTNAMIKSSLPTAPAPKTVFAFALPESAAPMAIFSALYRFPYTQFLDNTAAHQKNGRYSTIVFQPVEILEAWDDKVSVTNREQQLGIRSPITKLLSERLDVWGQGRVMNDPTLPPFQGGAVGYFGFGFNQTKQRMNDIPRAAFGIYDQCVSFDHAEKRAWYVVVSDDAETARTRYAHFQRLTAHNYLPPQDSVQPHLSWAPLTLPAQVKDSVRRLSDFIRSGSFDRSYLCHYFESVVPAGYDALAHYQTLRGQTQTPWGACMMLGGLNVMITDAEPVFTLQDKQIEMHHISHRVSRPEGSLRDDVTVRTLAQNQAALQEHRKMAKEQTIRLSALCTASGILGPSHPEIGEAAHEYNLTSVTRGILANNVSLSDLLDVFTPAPAYSAQPLDRALKVIAEMEPATRGPTCGHVATIGFNGSISLSQNNEVLLNNGVQLRFAVGAPVSADTAPDIWFNDIAQKADAALERIGSDTHIRHSRTA